MFKKYREMTSKEKAYFLKALEQKALMYLLFALLVMGLYFTLAFALGGYW